MNVSKYYRSYKKLQYESSYIDKEDSPCYGIEYVSIFVQQNKTKLRKKYSYKMQNFRQPTVILIQNNTGSPKSRKRITKHMSIPEINKSFLFKRAIRLSTRSSDTIPQSKRKFADTSTNHLISKYDSKNSLNFLKYISINQRNFKVYRCQVTADNAENCNNCCCSCNSDTMFEVMKDLYECYKKRNCDNCNCILCCNFTAGERGKEKSKLRPELNLESALKEIAMKGFALPEGKTPSEKKLIDTIRNKLGLPPEPMSSDMREKYTNAANAGLMLPLEGKSHKQKEKILRDLHGLGIPLPLGRTPSEKSLIAKILGKGSQRFESLAHNIQDAKRSGLLLVDYKGKSPDEIEKILRDLAFRGIPLPEDEDPLVKKLIEKVRADLGLPPEPKTPSMREKHKKAAEAGLLVPLEGKSPEEKELILQGLANMQIPLPEGRTPSEKALIAKVQKRQKLEELTASIMKEGKGPVDECICELLAPRHLAKLEKMRKAKAAGLLTPIKGKSKDQKEKILKGLAMQGFPLPKGETASDGKLLKKVRADLGLPPEPKTSAMRDKYAKAVEDGILLPLEGKSPKEKEKILRDLQARGIPLPKGRTPSEKALVAKISKEQPPKDKASKPLEEKKLRDLAMRGLPLPEGTTESDNKLLNKVRDELGLPPEPKTPAIRKKYEKAAEMGLMQPLEGKSLKEKENILRGLANIGVPLPKGRTPSEKALIAKIKGEPRDSSMLLQSKERMKPVPKPSKTPSEKMRKAKDAGLLTPLDGKSPSQQEQILRGLGMMGIPLPKGNTDSQNNLINKVRHDLGLPPEPKRSSMRTKYAKAADMGLLQPLEGKTPKEKENILRNLMELNIPLPKGRTPSEQALIDKVQRGEKSSHATATPSEKMRAAKAAGLLTPLKGKTPAQKEKILRGLAMNGLPLPEGKTKSEKDLLHKLRLELGLPPEPKTSSIRDKYNKAADAGLLVPLEGKTPKEKEKILRQLAEAGIPLPKARTPSEKALINKIKGEPQAFPKVTTSEKMRKAQETGLLTPLSGKTPPEKEKILRGLANLGIPLPEGKSPSEKNLINNIRSDLGLPPAPKTSAMREKHEKAAAAGLLVPLEGKSPKEKQKILEGLADMGIPLPEGRTDSEKRLIAKVKERIKPDLKGSKVSEPSITTEKIRQAKAAGLLTPLDNKSPEEKERILRNLVKLGLPLPEGKTRSEKSLINQIKKENKLGKESSAEKIRKAKAAGFLTPLDGKTPEQKEKILRGLAAAGLPLPKGKSRSEKDLINKIKASTGYVTPSPSEAMQKAKAAGLSSPLDGKTPSEKEKRLRQMAAAGIPLPEGSTPSEKDMIKKLNAKMRAKKASSQLISLKGKTPEEKEKILRGLVKDGNPLPEGKTPSEKQIIDKIRAEMGLPPSPKSPSMKEKYKKAQAAGIITPLEGKTLPEKEKILRRLNKEGIPLPIGRTPSEKLLIKTVKAGLSEPSTPFEEMTPEKKEKLIRGLIKTGASLPDAKTPSGKELIKKVRKDMGLPPEPETMSMKEKMRKAHSAGLITPLEGKTAAQKEKILRDLAEAGIPLPEGRTPSEKALKRKIEAEMKKHKRPSDEARAKDLSNKMKKAKELGLATPLEGKSPEEKERILRELAKLGLPLPDGTTKSEKQMINNIRINLGLPPHPETSSMKKREAQAAAAGILQPLEGLTPAEKEKLLKAQAKMGLPLPEGRTPSEKSLINKIKGATSEKSKDTIKKPRPSKLRKAKELGLLTPLEGKSPEEKERILRELAKLGVPLPAGTTKSEKQLINNIRLDLGLPPSPETSSMKKREAEAAAAGILYPLAGLTPAEKEDLLKAQAKMGLPLPEGRTPSEKSQINKIKEEVALSKVNPEKIRKAKAAGLLTPLKGKSEAEKDRIIRGRAEAGLPLPVGRTSSEKSLIKKIAAEYRKPTSTTAPTGEKVGRKPKGSELVPPLAGKTTAEKEKILQGLAEAGLPLPEGKTSTERALIKKVKEEHKTTKCERACGCDKKKIKFKHSYVKIRVTSPDISSLCPCPDECIPGVKGGVFLDNDGINVIIERAGDIPQYKQFGNISSKDLSYEYRTSFDKINYVTDPVPMYSGVKCKNCSNLLTSMYEDHSLKCSPNSNSHNYMTDIPLTYLSLSNEKCHKTRQHTNELRSSSENKICSNEALNESPIPSHDSLASGLTTYLTNTSTITTSSFQDSFDSIIIIKSETSLSFSSSYEDIDSSSNFFSEVSVFTLKSSPYITPLSNAGFNSSTILESEFLSNGVKYFAADTNTSREYTIRSPLIASTDKNILVNRNQMPDDVFQVFPMSSTKLSTVNHTKCNTKNKNDDKEPVIIITNLSSDVDLTSVVDDIISKKEFCEASSLFVVVPSDEENEICCNGPNCNQCNKLPDNCNTLNNDIDEDSCSLFERTSSKLEDLPEIPQQKFFFEKVPTTIVSSINNRGNLYNYVKHGQSWVSRNKICQITTPNAIFHRFNVVSTDTTQDRPCCCGTLQSSACTTNVMSEVITPEYITQGISSNKSESRKNIIQQASIISITPTMSSDQISECYQCPGVESQEQILRCPLSTTEQNKFHNSHTKKKKREWEQSDENDDSSTEYSDEEDILETTTMTPTTENYLICHEQKLKKNKFKKWVSGVKELRIDVTCDCKHNKPSFIKTEEESENKMRELAEQCCAVIPNRTKSFGQVISRLKRMTCPPVFRRDSVVSVGIQDSPGCILRLSDLPSKHDVSGHMTSLSNTIFQQTPVNVIYSKGKSTLRPLRSYAAIGSGGIYTQGGSKPVTNRTDAEIGLDFRDTGTEKYKSGSLNKKIQKNSKPYLKSSSRTKPIPRHTHRENEVGQNKVTLMKPNITQTTSRVKLNNNVFSQRRVKPSWTIEDLIRYYAKFKPEVLQTLISLTSIKKSVHKDTTCNGNRSSVHKHQPSETSRIPYLSKDMTCNENRRPVYINRPGETSQLPYLPKDTTCNVDVDRRYVYVHQPGETSQPPYVPQSQEVPSKETHELENRLFTGFKIEKHGACLDDLTLLKKDIKQQASFMSSSTISRCEINPCQRRQACHSPEEVLIFSSGNPLSEPLMKLQKLLEQNCTPEKVQYIFQLIEAGNLKDIDWEDAMSTSKEEPPSDLRILQALECRFPPCEAYPGCHVPDDVLQYPSGTPLLPNPVKLKKLVEENNNPEIIKHLLGKLKTRALKNNNRGTPMTGSKNLQPDIPVSVSQLTSMSNCNPLSCGGRSGCHLPDKVLQYPFGTPLPPDMVKFKKLIEQNENKEKVKQLFEQLQARNVKTCQTLLKESTNHLCCKPTKMLYQFSPNQECSAYHSRNDFFKKPLGPRLSTYLELKKLLKENNNLNKIKRLINHIENGTLKNRDREGETAIPTNTSSDDCITSKLLPKNSISIISSCHSPHEILLCPPGYPLSPALQTLRYILEKYYDPVKVNKIFKQLECNDYSNLDWAGALAKPPENLSEQNEAPRSTNFCPYHPCEKHPWVPIGGRFQQDNAEYSPDMDVPTQLEALKKMLERLDEPPVKNLIHHYSDPPPEIAPSNCTDPTCRARRRETLYDKFSRFKTSMGKKSNKPKKCRRQCRSQCQTQCNNLATLESHTDFLPDNYPPPETVPTTSPGRSPGCHLPDQYPCRTPLPQLSDQDIDPKKLQMLFEELEANDLDNLDWKCAFAILEELECNNFDDDDYDYDYDYDDDYEDISSTPLMESGSISSCQDLLIGSEGTYTQQNSNPAPYNMNVGVGVDFRNAGTDTEYYNSDYLNKKTQINSDQYPQSAAKFKSISRSRYRENEVGLNKVTLMKPNTTQTTSRMKFDNNVFLQKRYKPSWTIDDIIRYYAKFKPEVLETLVSLTRIKKPVIRDMRCNEDRRYVYLHQPGETSQFPYLPKNTTCNEDRRYVYIHQPDVTSQPLYLPQNQEVPTKGTNELDRRPFTGFKIEKPGKNSSQRGLSNELSEIFQ